MRNSIDKCGLACLTGHSPSSLPSKRLAACTLICCILGLASGIVAADGLPDEKAVASGQIAADKSTDADKIELAKVDFFQQRVLPVLREHCFECHSHASGEASGGLMLDSLAAMKSGGTRGATLQAGKTPQDSLLVRAVRYADVELQMPPEGMLPDEDIAAIERWIAEGAAVPSDMLGNEASDSAPSHAGSAATSHWAYQLPQRKQFANDCTEQNAASGSVIDAIVNDQLCQAGLTLSPVADRATLLRRLSYDLLGLSPERESLDRCLVDPRDDEQVMAEWIDNMLASPHFGERWARHWMDVARYADNKGYVFREDREYTQAFQYRDWLVRAFNEDLPYDDFVKKQLAADIIEQDDAERDLPALGFLTLGRRFLNNRHDIIDDRLDVVSRGLMGMTLACARCHDHKYDPITQADYYALFGVFLNTEEPGGEPWPHRLVESNEMKDSFILIRGSPGNRGDKVERRFVSFLSTEQPSFQKGSGRLELAERIVAPDNPLTARVLANRIWMNLTGASLVESPSDFGTRCPPPLQSALLDHLALSLQENGWSVKQLIREIVNSRVYQQQSRHRPDCYAADPANELFWKMNRRRLDLESFRDTLLQRTGELSAAIYGRSEQIAAPPFSHRRTVYAYIDRQNLPSMFRTFDLASPDSHSPARAQTSVPQQGLYLLNSDFVSELALDLGARARSVSLDDRQRVTWLFEQILARTPTDSETNLMLDFVRTQPAATPPIREERWICGYASYDPERQACGPFNRLPAFIDGQWRGGKTLPDPQLGWCLLSADGGHPGNDLARAVVRRWIAPRTGRVAVSGRLGHGEERGDGVRATAFHGPQQLDQWIAQNNKVETTVKSFAVQAGDTVDFITDCVSGPSYDSFDWKITVRYTDDKTSYRSQEQLPEPLRAPLMVFDQLAGALLATNELAFID